jgi:hypothetical protein
MKINRKKDDNAITCVGRRYYYDHLRFPVHSSRRARLILAGSETEIKNNINNYYINWQRKKEWICGVYDGTIIDSFF